MYSQDILYYIDNIYMPTIYGYIMLHSLVQEQHIISFQPFWRPQS